MKHKWIKDYLRPILIAVIFGILASSGYASDIFQSLRLAAGDRLFLDRPSDDRIAIVAIDDSSLTKIGRWPWDRSVHAELISELSRMGASVIAYDVNFPEAQNDQEDQALAYAIKQAGNVILPIELQLERNQTSLTYQQDRSVRSISLIGASAKRAGHSNTPPDIDGIVRRIPIAVGTNGDGAEIYAFGYEVASLIDPQLAKERIPVDRTKELILSYTGNPTNAFPVIPAANILQGQIEASEIRDKIIFVGSTAYDLHDQQLVPTSRGTPMPGVMIHATLADTLLQRHWIQTIPTSFMIAYLMLLAILLGLVIPHTKHRLSIAFALTLLIFSIVGSFLAFDHGWLFDLAWPTITIIFVYSAVTIERRVTSEKDRRLIKKIFSQYVSPSVVDSLLKDPSAIKLGGERRRMTVLFTDIRSFTSMTEKQSPEELVGILNQYLDKMTNVVFAHQGVLDKYIGDAVMAFWNAPLNQKDHAFLAVSAALEMRSSLAKMNEDRVFGGEAWNIGMGLNTGDMIAGNIGGVVHTDYTVIGDAVNLASRVESLTKEYGVDILITEETAKELDGRYLLRKLDRVRVKGKEKSVWLYEVICLMERASMPQKEFARDYEEALNAYMAKRFVEATTIIKTLYSRRPKDVPTSILDERCQIFLQDPPPDNWDGVWTFTKK